VVFCFVPGAEFKVTPDVRNALRECEGTYMPVQPSIKTPKVKLPSTFCEWSVGKALLDNQDLSAAAIGVCVCVCVCVLGPKPQHVSRVQDLSAAALG